MVLGLAMLAPPARAWELRLPLEELIDRSFMVDVRDWATAPTVVLALEGRARRVGALPREDLEALDAQWRAERRESEQPLIASVLSSPVSSYLTAIQAASVGLYSAIVVMDANGLNIGQSVTTPGYWQGETPAFQGSFAAGPGAVYLAEPAYHDGSRTWRVWLAMAIDNDGGPPLGAVSLEVNLTELERQILGDG